MAAYEVLLLNTAVPQIQAAQAGDTYVVPRDIAVNAQLTVTGNVGVGTTSPSVPLMLLKGAAGTDVAYLLNAGGYGFRFQAQTGGSGTNNLLYVASGETLSFGVNNSEQMRLTSTGLGIGTSSIAGRLTIGGYGSSNQTPDIQITRSSSGTAIQTGPNITFADGTTNNTTTLQVTQGRFGVWNYGAGSWQERLSVDSSGNLGLGVTPSAWGSSYKALQIGTGGALVDFNVNDRFAMSANAFWNGTSWIYLASAANATIYFQNDGTHAWYTAPTGTAGNAISLTQAMTLDAPVTPRLLIGTTTAGAGNSNNTNLTVAGGATVYQSVLASGGQELYLIVQSGLTGVYSRSNDPLVFGTNNTERARITSGGDFYVSGSGVDTGIGAFLYTAGYCRFNTAGTVLAQFRYSGSAVGSISTDGVNTAYNTSSDYRLKDNPQPLTGSGAFIDALKPKTWDWKSGGKGVGFIAHEVAEVSPGTVVGEKDAVDADGNPIMQAMEYGSAEFIANIIAELQSLRARVAQLEGN